MVFLAGRKINSATKRPATPKIPQESWGSYKCLKSRAKQRLFIVIILEIKKARTFVGLQEVILAGHLPAFIIFWRSLFVFFPGRIPKSGKPKGFHARQGQGLFSPPSRRFQYQPLKQDIAALEYLFPIGLTDQVADERQELFPNFLSGGPPQ